MTIDTLVMRLLVALVALSACSRNADDSNNTQVDLCGANIDVQIAVGQKIQNPYTVQSMQIAYQSLMKQALAEVPVDLQPTHLYVRFLPKDTTEYQLLKSDSLLQLFPYPLDYVLSEGSQYTPPTLPPNAIPWQYTKVPIGYVFPPVVYEVLDQLYIPIEIEGAVALDTKSHTPTLRVKSAGDVSWDLLWVESMKLTGNLDTTGGQIPIGVLPKKWTPTATITVWDDLLQSCIPLEGVKVQARHLLHWTHGWTNKDGYATMGSYYSNVSYSIVWEHHTWDIRDGNLLQAYYNGPNSQKGHWELHIKGGKSEGFASIHRALYRYTFKDVQGLLRPTSYRATKVAYIDQPDPGYLGIYYSFPTLGVIPDIQIYRYDSHGVPRKTHELFATTTHELTHGAHFVHATGIFLLSPPWIKESWATAAEWSLTNLEYADWVKLPAYADRKTQAIISDPLQKTWTPKSKIVDYSPIFIDLIDKENQHFRGVDFPNDQVWGYDIGLLNSIVNQSSSMQELKTNVKNQKPAGVTNQQIDQLFVIYEATFDK